MDAPEVTSTTIAGLLGAILIIHQTKAGSFGRLWGAMSGSLVLVGGSANPPGANFTGKAGSGSAITNAIVPPTGAAPTNVNPNNPNPTTAIIGG